MSVDREAAGFRGLIVRLQVWGLIVRCEGLIVRCIKASAGNPCHLHVEVGRPGLI